MAPHDLRRTCARLCHSAGGELEQIQFLLGHRSVETTERYLGSRQRIVHAVNDKLAIEPYAGRAEQFTDKRTLQGLELPDVVTPSKSVLRSCNAMQVAKGSRYLAKF